MLLAITYPKQALYLCQPCCEATLQVLPWSSALKQHSKHITPQGR